MKSNLQSAREALIRLSAIPKDSDPVEAAAAEALALEGLTALDSVELELGLLRLSHSNAIKALMHRMGDPG